VVPIRSGSKPPCPPLPKVNSTPRHLRLPMVVDSSAANRNDGGAPLADLMKDGATRHGFAVRTWPGSKSDRHSSAIASQGEQQRVAPIRTRLSGRRAGLLVDGETGWSRGSSARLEVTTEPSQGRILMCALRLSREGLAPGAVRLRGCRP
jgi:hypothetical protein